ncbi:MAG: hypothetical protein ABI882_04710 [Acidobacteriota bacterium]
MNQSFTRIIACAALLLLLGHAIQGQTPSRRQFDQAVAIEDPVERVAALKEFLKENPEEELSATAREQVVLSWAQLAERQLAANNIGEAVQTFRRALSDLPAQMTDRFYEETVARIPFVISARGYRPEAIEVARLLEARFAKEPLRLGALGELYMNLEAPGEAIRALEAAVKLAPDEIRLRRPLAAAYRMSLRLPDAVKEFEQVAALDQRDGRAYGELGNLARARGDYAEANRFYRSQLRADEKQMAAIKGLALSALAEGKEDEAQRQLDRVRETKSQSDIDNDLHLQTQMSFYYLALGKTEKATEAAVRALTIEPRYSWTRIAAAEVEIAAGRPFEAEKHLLSALRYADFVTLRFTLGKLYLAVEDFDGALEQFARVMTLNSGGKFKTKLGGVLDVEADGIKELLALERQAAIFVAVPPTTEEQFTMAEALIRFDARIRNLKSTPTNTQSRRSRAVNNSPTIEALANSFIDAEGGRRAFRSLYAAQRLAAAGQSLPFVLKLSDQVLDLAEAATQPEGSLLEFPNYDRESRLRILRGRALDTRGWALFQMKQNREAMTALAEAIDAYGGISEAKLSVWRLAMVRETVGEEREALGLYLAAYEPPTDPNAVDVKRTLIEVLYRKVNGSLDGLDEKLGVAPRAAGPVATTKAVGTGTSEEAKQTTVDPPPPVHDSQALVMRSVPVGKGAYSGTTILVKSSAPKPSAIGRPVAIVEEETSTVADLPEASGETPTLALGRRVVMGKGAYAGSTMLVKSSAPKPLSIEGPVVLLESSERDAQTLVVSQTLVLRRMNPRLLRWPAGDSSEAPRVSSEVTQTLIEVEARDVAPLVRRRMNARLLRLPMPTSAEPALAPSDVVLEVKAVETATEKSVEGSRPRVVNASRPRTTSDPTAPMTNESPGNTRSRRVTKPQQR